MVLGLLDICIGMALHTSMISLPTCYYLLYVYIV